LAKNAIANATLTGRYTKQESLADAKQR